MTDEFDSSIPDSSSESFDSEPEVMPEIPSDSEPIMESMPELIDGTEIESAAEIQPEPESASELTPELIDEPEIEPTVEIQPEPELAPELMDEPEIEPLAEIQPEPDSVPDVMDEPEIEPVAEIQPDLVDEYIGDENSLGDEFPIGSGISIDETPVDNPVAIIDENPLVDEILIGDEISVDENPIDGEPLASDEVPAGREIAPEIQNESQPETESTPGSEADEIPQYLAELDAISEGDILQQADLSAVNPEMISEQDGLVEEGSPEKQPTAGNEPVTNVFNMANTTASYSQIGVQSSLVDSGDDDVTSQSQIDETSQRQPFRTDYSEDDLGKAAAEINNENADINKFVQDLKQQGLAPEQYLEQKRTEYAALDAGVQAGSMTDPANESMPDQEGDSEVVLPMPADINLIKDAQERDITIRRWGDDGLIQLRAYDSATGDVPETPNLGTAGMTNLKIEEEDGQTKVRLQDIVIPPDYRKSGIAGNMLDETIDIAQAKGASEIYGVIENEEALSYWKHMEEKGTGWKVESSEGAAYGHVRYDLSNPQQAEGVGIQAPSVANSNAADIPISQSPSILETPIEQQVVEEFDDSISDFDKERLTQAVGELSQVEWLQPEVWKELTPGEKAIALNQAGAIFGNLYEHPEPPLIVEPNNNPLNLGHYGDGFSYNSETGQVEGSDYGIWMNETFDATEKLFGDDPALALETYLHEFRHSYQHEQANRYEKPQFQNLVDNAESASLWSENFKNYVPPKTDFDKYQNQIVERDARSFSGFLRKLFYGT